MNKLFIVAAAALFLFGCGTRNKAGTWETTLPINALEESNSGGNTSYNILTDKSTCVQYIVSYSGATGKTITPRLDRYKELVLEPQCTPSI